MKQTIKVAHMGDTHLRDTQYQLRLRGMDFTRAFSAAAQLAKAQGADAILHSGDLLDTLRPSARTVLDLRHLHESMVAEGITMFVISGNHDFTTPPWPEVIADDCNTTDCLGLQCFDNKRHVIRKGRCELSIHGLPFLPRQALIEQARNVDADVLMWHGMVREFVDYPIPADSEVVGLDDFPRDRYQLVALADIHEPSVINRDDGTAFCYPGSTELCSRGEPLEKGFYMHTFEAEDGERMKLVNSEFIQIPNRLKMAMHISSEVDLADVIQKVRNQLAEQPLVMVTYHSDFADTPQRLSAAIDTTRCILRCSMRRSKTAQRDEVREMTARLTMFDFLPRYLQPDTKLFALGQQMIDPKVDAQQALEAFVENALEVPR